MNRSELILKLATECGLSNDDAALCVDIFVDEMKKALLEGNRIEIRGFGSFKMKEYKGYTGRNPKTGEKVEVRPKRMPFFKAGKELKDHVNDAS
ncbi:MAG: integration host factor subunit beta [Desulfovibrio sp.]|nr:integration host factor subunit beta [Desulfovibrio sp.]